MIDTRRVFIEPNSCPLFGKKPEGTELSKQSHVDFDPTIVNPVSTSLQSLERTPDIAHSISTLLAVTDDLRIASKHLEASLANQKFVMSLQPNKQSTIMPATCLDRDPRMESQRTRVKEP